VTRLWDGRSGVRISIETRDFSVLQNVQTGSEGPPSLLFNTYRGVFFPGIKRPGLEAGHSPPNRAEVKISGVIPLFSLYVFMA
jgi:hypothetical protein